MKTCDATKTINGKVWICTAAPHEGKSVVGRTGWPYFGEGLVIDRTENHYFVPEWRVKNAS